MTGSSSKHYFSHVVEVYHFRRSRIPFMRINYRAADSVCSSELFIMTLVDDLSLILVSSIVKRSYHMQLLNTVRLVE